MFGKYLTSWYLSDKLNKHENTSKIYVFLKKHFKRGDFSFDSLLIPKPVEENRSKKRINIILPSLRKSQVFGGINTALKFFSEIIKKGNFDGRIIVNEREKYDVNLTISTKKFGIDRNKIQFLNDDLHVKVSNKDYFIFTTWKSAFVFNKIIDWQEKKYSNNTYKSIYLIQDYEPGFVAWSTEFALAESTYKINSNRIIAVFNSKELFDYFKINNYSFSKEYYFRPKLNEILKHKLITQKNFPKRKKIIIVYGRPNEPRNAFELVKESIILWSKNYSDSSNWKVYSIGAPNSDIKLNNNIMKNKGKLSLEDYANIMLKAYAGISLMISPHPSYPPLEMSTFGVKTITNDFMNKHLSGFNSNLYSVPICMPEIIAKKLIQICESYNGKGIIGRNSDYLHGNDFEKVTSELVRDIIRI